MFSTLHPFRLVAAVLAALLMVAGLQSVASAATARRISISATPSAGVFKSTVTFTGKLTKSRKGSVVIIQRKSGSSWIKAGSTKTTNGAGSYSIHFARPSSLGNYSYRAFAPKGHGLRAATSKVVIVAALKPTFASLSATPSTLAAGSSTTLAGTVYPFVKGTVITIQRKSGSTWSTVTTTTVTANGTFSKSVPVTTSSTFHGLVARAGSNAPVTTNERTVIAKPKITTAALPNATRLGAYTTTLTTLGNLTGIWTASPLPAGITLNPATGVISGTPTTIGDTNVVIGFTQSGTGLAAANVTLTLRVNQAVAPTITTTALPSGTLHSAYTTTLTATGNPAGTWTASPLPAGLSVNASTGVISGTPTAVGDTQVVIGFTQTNTGLTATPKTLLLHIANVAAPVITTTSLPSGSIGVAYTTTLTAQGNPAGTWTASPLPNGLNLNASTGVISGTPTTQGDTQVTIGFTDSGTPPQSAATKTLLLQIDPGANPVISTSSLPDGTRLSSYTTTLTATGNPVGTWTASPLPNGLNLSASTGVISGTPTTVGDTQVVIGFTQTNNGLPATPKTLTLHVNQAPAPVISTTSFPNATRLSAYSTQLMATGNPAGTWSVDQLPAGLSLDPSTGVISGTPTTVGDTDVLVGFTQTNSGVAAISKTITLHVMEAPAPVISTASLPDGTRTESYTTTLTNQGNVVGVWTASPLPAGLSLDAATGTISGTPTTVGDTQVVIGFTQTSTGLTATPKTLTLHVAEVPAPVISTLGLPNATRFHAYSTQLTATGNPAGTWTASPLPAGLSLNASTGIISGTPTNAGDTSVQIGFTQTSSGLAATPKTLTLHVVQSAPVITTTALPDGHVGSPYSFQMQVSPAPVGTWRLEAPNGSQTSMPPLLGLTFHTNGTISGTPLHATDLTMRIRFTETSTGLSTLVTLNLHTS